jgi:hypothetical protein
VLFGGCARKIKAAKTQAHQAGEHLAQTGGGKDERKGDHREGHRHGRQSIAARIEKPDLPLLKARVER